MPTTRKFDKQSFMDNDPVCRKAVKKALAMKWGIKLVDNPDPFGIDLLQYDGDNIVAGYELERRQIWTTQDFPFDTIHIPARKMKYAKLPFMTYYVVVNKDISFALIMDLPQITKDEDNRDKWDHWFCDSGLERFYNIRTEDATLVKLIP